jgi:hypothetical protein
MTKTYSVYRFPSVSSAEQGRLVKVYEAEVCDVIYGPRFAAEAFMRDSDAVTSSGVKEGDILVVTCDPAELPWYVTIRGRDKVVRTRVLDLAP